MTGHSGRFSSTAGIGRLLFNEHKSHHFKVLLINGHVQNGPSGPGMDITFQRGRIPLSCPAVRQSVDKDIYIASQLREAEWSVSTAGAPARRSLYPALIKKPPRDIPWRVFLLLMRTAGLYSSDEAAPQHSSTRLSSRSGLSAAIASWSQ